MTFSQAIPTVFRKYATFNGRADRSEYWWFALGCFIVNVVLNTLFSLTGIKLFYFLDAVFGLAVLVPSLAVCVRRLHDVNKSGWWIFISLIPLVGWVWIIWLLATPSYPETNEYGPVPQDY